MNTNKAFLKAFDEGLEVVGEYGQLSDNIIRLVDDKEGVYLDEDILNCGLGLTIEDELVGNGDHHVEMEAVIQVEDRFFKVCYDGIGKDLDEWVDYEVSEVVPKEIIKTIYVDKMK